MKRFEELIGEAEYVCTSCLFFYLVMRGNVMRREIHAECHHEKGSDGSRKEEIYACRHAKFRQSLSRLMLIDTLSVSCLASDCVSNFRQLRPYLNIRIVSQIMSRLQATSRNQLCVTRIEIRDSSMNKMYMERADILHSVERL